jgi:hypothetical protein
MRAAKALSKTFVSAPFSMDLKRQENASDR